MPSTISKVSEELMELTVDIFNNSARDTFIYYAEFILSHPDYEDWEIKIINLKSISINQNPLTSYMDEIAITAEIPLVILPAIIKRKDNLRGSLRLQKYYIDPIVGINRDMVLREYYVILPSIEELYRHIPSFFYNLNDPDAVTAVSGTDSYLSMTIDVTFQLMEKTMYEKRLVKVNTIFDKATTVQDAIHWITNAFEITTVDIVPPDNTYPYTNMKIPPFHGLDTVFNYIHETYGIYMKGSAFYYTDNCAYIFPPLDTEKSNKNQVYLVYAPIQDAIPRQANSYKKASETDENAEELYIFTTGPVEFSTQDYSGENTGTVFVPITSELTVPTAATQVTQDGTMKLNPNVVTSIQPTANRTYHQEAANISRAPNTNNPYLISSQQAASDYIYGNAVWLSSEPFAIKPNTKIRFYQDNDSGVIEERNGKILAVTYISQRYPKITGDLILFTFNCSISFYLEKINPPE